MTKPKKMQILFFALIPVGIILLIFSIKLVRNTFSGNIILEMPYLQKSATFEITKPGTYSIWHKGQFFRRAPLDEFRPAIINETESTEIRLSSILFRPNSNNGNTARMELFRFSASAGKYRLELREGSSISGIENSFIKRLPAKMVDYDKYFIQVRKSQPLIFLIAGIILIAVSGFIIIGGLVIGILSDQIFK
jgi:hypothetical protein